MVAALGKGEESLKIPTSQELEALIASLHQTNTPEAKALLNILADHAVISKAEYSRLIRDNVNMEGMLKVLRPEVATYQFILKAAKDTYPFLKDVPLEKVPETLVLALEEYIRHSLTDVLTGVHNDRYFNQSLDASLSEGGNLCLAMFDIDDMKGLNTLARDAGNSVLTGICKIAEKTLPRSYEVCRLSGGADEFAIPIHSSIDDVVPILNNFRSEVNGTKFEYSDGTVPRKVGISIGIAKRENEDSRISLLGKADAALRKAKSDGKNRIRIYGEKGGALYDEHARESLVSKMADVARYAKRRLIS